MSVIMKDPRAISAIYAPGEGSSWMVGATKITKIEPYEENGQMAPVLWFEVWKGDHLFVRVNAAHVECVTYKQGETS